ncbi:MAG TPA: glycoside hydrolase family 88 protein [Polyangia bacterium]|jgi:rhamnogalacturonyl hydrolase YesR|nr:glycoside hydrolase family 88 protein [Polyangia bacterium]
MTGAGGSGSGGSGGSNNATGGSGTGGDMTVDGGSDATVPQDSGTTTDMKAMIDTGSGDVVVSDVSGDTANGNLSADVISIMRRVADWQLGRNGPDQLAMKDWIRGSMWVGISALYQMTKDEKYFTAIKNWAGNNWDLSGGAGARGDNQCAAQTFFESYLLDPMPANMIRLTAKSSFDQLVANTPQGRVEWWWEDALFMVPPGFARLGAATGDKQYFATMNKMYWDTYAFLWSAKDGLMFRDHQGNDKNFWARGNGWVIGGAARVLEYLPQDDPMRPNFVKLIQDMAAALMKAQGADGLWRANLLTPSQFPGPETSGTGFFTYGIAWGVNNGILDKATYLPVATKGWNGLVSHVDTAGKLGYVQPVGVGPADAPADSTVPYGVGGFLLAGSEMAKLLP